MRRVLMVSCDGLGNGGVQAVIMNIVRKLYKEYTFDALLFTGEKRFFDDEFESYGGKIHRIPRYDGSNFIRRKADYYIRGRHLYEETKKLLKEYGPYDVVHCHDEAESAIIIKAAKESGVPIRIVHTHVITQKGNPLLTVIDKHRKKVIHECATHRLGCSQKACRSFYNNDDFIVVNNSFDETRFYTQKNVEYTDFNLVQIGRVSEIKNQLFSLTVFKYIVDQYPNARFDIIGYPDCDYIEKVKIRIRELNLDNNVNLLPGNADSPKILETSAAMIFPSTREGFGIAVIEAQAMGVRCYVSTEVPDSTNCGGVTFLSLKENPEKWAKVIMDDYIEDHGRHCKYDVKQFTSTEVIKQILKIYESNLLR